MIVSQATGIFKAFYDADLIDEEVILEWGKTVTKICKQRAVGENSQEMRTILDLAQGS